MSDDDAIRAQDADEPNDPPRPFMEHLMALRSCLIGAATAWVLCCIVAGVFAPTIIEWMQSPVAAYENERATEADNAARDWAHAILDAAETRSRLAAMEERKAPAAEIDKARQAAAEAEAAMDKATKSRQNAESRRVTIQGFKVTSGFTLILSAALWGGTVLAFPFFIYYILKFIFPALRGSEKRAIMFCLGGGSLFFLGGLWMAYSKTLPLAVDVLMGFSEWVGLKVRFVEVGDLFSLVLKTLVAFGLVFQLPLIIFTLGWLGVISSDALRRFRRFAIVIAFFFGMVLTPPDPMSQLVMAVPLCLFYEACIWLIKLRETMLARKDGRRAGAAK